MNLIIATKYNNICKKIKLLKTEKKKLDLQILVYEEKLNEYKTNHLEYINEFEKIDLKFLSEISIKEIYTKIQIDNII